MTEEPEPKKGGETSGGGRILVCDDDLPTLELMRAILEASGHEPIACDSFQDAIREAKSRWERSHEGEHCGPDIGVLDVHLEDGNGFDLCRLLQEAHPKGAEHFPVILVTSSRCPTTEKQAFMAGASDFLHKPFAHESLMHRVNTHLQLARQKGNLRDQVEAQTIHISKLQNTITIALTSLCGQRDRETGEHIIRTQLYARTLGRQILETAAKKSFSNIGKKAGVGELDEELLDAIYRHAPLHDIGKVAVPDHILHKPGKLTPEEFKVIQKHPEAGYRAIEEAESKSGISMKELRVAKNIILHHHERWDGSGYPRKLARTDIPLEARIMSLCDVYDALRSKRVYKAPVPHLASVREILVGEGTQFDPFIVCAFLQCHDTFEKISLEYGDPVS
jgi:putative two-component system response regulator